MLAGFERYYQIARCFRDEAQRADRQLEFTQLDIEMAFVTEAEVLELVEGLFASIWREVAGVEVPLPFPRHPVRGGDAPLRLGPPRPALRARDRGRDGGRRRLRLRRLQLGAAVRRRRAGAGVPRRRAR